MRFVTRATTVVAATLLAASSLGAQMKLSVAAGATAPIGDAGDAFSLGYNATVGLSFKPALAPLGLRVEGMFNQLDGKDPSPVGARIMALTANGTYSLVPNLYLIGGVGMYNAKATDLPTGVTAESSNELGINAGVGFNFPLPTLQPFAEIRFHHIMTEGTATQLVPITFGIRF
jgi:hypothetical protein